MKTSEKIRVGIVGASPDRGFASVAHIPALQALPSLQIVAVCTTRPESAEATAKHFDIPLAFSDPQKLAQHSDVDLVTVCVKVPDHYGPVMAAIDAGKHVYCEWPLGRDTDEAVRMLDAAKRKGVRHAVGLQGRVSPAINYARDLIAQGNGANLLTITGGHQIDALCYCLGEFRELAAFVVSQRDRILVDETGEVVAKTSPDQLAVNGIIGEAAVVSFQIRGGMARGTEFLFEIHGDEGDLVLTATTRASMQRQELSVQGASGAGAALAPMPIPAKYRWAPEGVPVGSPYNVAQLYVQLAESIRSGTPVVPTFEAAVERHRLIDAIVRSSESGTKQVPAGVASRPR